ncbi:hypothetical protein D918_06925 [Trichuris suis]|nr:hypothetical protein D918_06925 [Trichuris suis]
MSMELGRLYSLIREQCFPEFSKHDREIRLASENFLWNSLITDACLLYSPSQIALTAIFAALKEENMEGFQRSAPWKLVAMAIRDDNSEKANRLIEKVHGEQKTVLSGSGLTNFTFLLFHSCALAYMIAECYALVSECPAVPPEFGALIQKRINECVEFINRAVSVQILSHPQTLINSFTNAWRNLWRELLRRFIVGAREGKFCKIVGLENFVFIVQHAIA